NFRQPRRLELFQFTPDVSAVDLLGVLLPHQKIYLFRRQRIRKQHVDPVRRIEQAHAFGELVLELLDDLFELRLRNRAQAPRSLDQYLQLIQLEELQEPRSRGLAHGDQHGGGLLGLRKLHGLPLRELAVLRAHFAASPIPVSRTPKRLGSCSRMMISPVAIRRPLTTISTGSPIRLSSETVDPRFSAISSETGISALPSTICTSTGMLMTRS